MSHLQDVILVCCDVENNLGKYVHILTLDIGTSNLQGFEQIFHMYYEEQLKYKDKEVNENLIRIGKIKSYKHKSSAI